MLLTHWSNHDSLEVGVAPVAVEVVGRNQFVTLLILLLHVEPHPFILQGGSSDDVVKLTDANFEELVVKSNDMWLVEFYAPWYVSVL